MKPEGFCNKGLFIFSSLIIIATIHGKIKRASHPFSLSAAEDEVISLFVV
jgi:hypothetical protein